MKGCFSFARYALVLLGALSIHMCCDLQRATCPYPGCVFLNTEKPWTLQCDVYRARVRESPGKWPPYSYVICPNGFTPEPPPRRGHRGVATDYCEFHKKEVFPRLFKHRWIPQDKCEVRRTINTFVSAITGALSASEDLEQDMWDQGQRGIDFPRVSFGSVEWNRPASLYLYEEPISPRTVPSAIISNLGPLTAGPGEHHHLSLAPLQTALDDGFYFDLPKELQACNPAANEQMGMVDGAQVHSTQMQSNAACGDLVEDLGQPHPPRVEKSNGEGL
ncbi:Putative protein of unknown function [Podospora comata]|uniref:Uncharacterized protein n=1 Tax=Podospora comata TaxID=48703 RepID=A0ABY6S8N6_PODCO|nr:Putative protein of unknown function [Podospora comata]